MSEAVVLSWKRVLCLFNVGNEFLPRVKKLMNPGILFTSEKRKQQDVKSQIGAVILSVGVKRELSMKVKVLLIYQMSYILTFTSVMTTSCEY